ncbi:MAG TPA: GNAT family N-acetyltransferase [Phycisphaerales bacterium]|nr:GNAT family N-acetyltransferase [Phycisphaerales bacterium]
MRARRGELALAARAMFGLAEEEPSGPPAVRVASAACAGEVARGLGAGGVCLVTGPSGSGKSTLLGALRARGGCVEAGRALRARLLASGTALVELGVWRGLGLEARLGRLARAGLAEARLFARRPAELSEGELARLVAAAGLEEARRVGAWGVVIDEFASLLDRVTARGVAAGLARWVRGGAGPRLVVASAHEDMEGFLAPDVAVRCRLGGGAEVAWRAGSGGRSARASGQRIDLEPGTRADYAALARFHYRAGAPATMVGVVRAVEPGRGELAGVLVVSMPTLNGPWRELAWPGRYAGPDRRRGLRRLNAEVRTISRVVVEPRYRGLGLGRRLVEAYLRRPLTAATEAVAAMGGACPFFARAGMREYEVGPGGARVPAVRRPGGVRAGGGGPGGPGGKGSAGTGSLGAGAVGHGLARDTRAGRGRPGARESGTRGGDVAGFTGEGVLRGGEIGKARRHEGTEHGGRKG